MNLDIIQFVTILGTVIGAMIYMVTELRFFQKEIKEEIKIQNQHIDQQSQRTDKLYEMFIDLLKEVKK
jgi:cell division protein FtsL